MVDGLTISHQPSAISHHWLRYDCRVPASGAASMRFLKWLPLLFVPVLGVVLSGQAPRTFKARLSPVPIDIAMQAAVAGSGSVLAALVPVAAIGTLGIALVAGQQPPAAVYTAEQAAAGRAAYQANCASCHLADLGGRNEAPQLAGINFMNTWRARSTRDLLELIQS